MHYLLNRFLAAVSALSGNGHIKQRLISSFEVNLDGLDEDELPEVLQESFRELRGMMHRAAPLNGEGHIRASVRKMSMTETQECAQLIVKLYAGMACHGKEMLPKLAAVPDTADIPAFLAKS